MPYFNDRRFFEHEVYKLQNEILILERAKVPPAEVLDEKRGELIGMRNKVIEIITEELELLYDMHELLPDEPLSSDEVKDSPNVFIGGMLRVKNAEIEEYTQANNKLKEDHPSCFPSTDRIVSNQDPLLSAEKTSRRLHWRADLLNEIMQERHHPNVNKFLAKSLCRVELDINNCQNEVERLKNLSQAR